MVLTTTLSPAAGAARVRLSVVQKVERAMISASFDGGILQGLDLVSLGLDVPCCWSDRDAVRRLLKAVARTARDLGSGEYLQSARENNRCRLNFAKAFDNRKLWIARDLALGRCRSAGTTLAICRQACRFRMGCFGIPQSIGSRTKALLHPVQPIAESHLSPGRTTR